MEVMTGGLAPASFAAAAAVTMLACLVKGVVGFGMPMIMVSGLGAFLPVETALASLILPMLATNLSQGLRDGLGPALATARRHRRLFVVALATLAVSAQLVRVLPADLLFAILGLPIVAYALAGIAGLPMRFDLRHRRQWEIVLGAIAGFFGGFFGVWGPPLVIYLASCAVPKAESMRVQGVIFLLGSATLGLAHVVSGVIDRASLPLSAAMVVPAMAGLWIGYRLHDRVDQEAFRHWTLVVLALTGLNLLRRALTG